MRRASTPYDLQIAAVVRESGKLFLVDSVSGAGCAELEIDECGLEAARAGRGEQQDVVLRAQKILQCAGQRREKRGKLRAAVIYQRSRRRGEHRLRNERGTRDAEVLRTVH
jgi:hypothetical protein